MINITSTFSYKNTNLNVLKKNVYNVRQNNVDSINAKANILDLLYMLMTRKQVE